MTAIEIILLIVGMLFILGSFWVTERLSSDELEHISELSREEMSVLMQRELEGSKQKVTKLVEETIDATKDRTERALEQQTNEKIMAINEYSDTVIEKMNKTHNEIMFLYSMLNDKHTELTNFSSSLTQQLQDFKEQEEELTSNYLELLRQQTLQSVQAPQEQPPSNTAPQPKAQTEPVEREQPAEPEPAVRETAEAVVPSLPEPVKESEPAEPDIREEIIRLYREGKDSVAIARRLGMGVGEVRLILGLYKGDHSGEI